MTQSSSPPSSSPPSSSPPSSSPPSSSLPAPSTRRNVFDLSREARVALASGAAPTAVRLLREALDAEPRAFGLWLNYATALRQTGDVPAALLAVDEALTLEPRDVSALLLKATLLERAGNPVEAGRFYGVALLFRSRAPDEPAVQAALAHAEAVHGAYRRDLEAAMDAAFAEALGTPSQPAAGPRRFLDLASGRRRNYWPEPSTYLYPGLPVFEFYDRALTPWIARFEAQTDAIRRELDHARTARPDLFAPYVAEPKGVPVDQWAELNHSPRWSALQVIRAGTVQPYAADLFPATLEALSGLPQPAVPGRTPSAMFSALQPRTRIPPHTGVSNARLVVHLPLIVPPGCGFRVGAETRSWEVGRAWVFDDTIEHEAWNDSDDLRVILIADIWNMFMTEADRTAYVSIVDAVDRFHGGAPADPSGGL